MEQPDCKRPKKTLEFKMEILALLTVFLNYMLILVLMTKQIDQRQDMFAQQRLISGALVS